MKKNILIGTSIAMSIIFLLLAGLTYEFSFFKAFVLLFIFGCGYALTGNEDGC